MNIRILILFIFCSVDALSQTDSNKIFRAFPITDYIIDLTDSTKLVQLEMPENIKLNKKQVGIIWGVYNNSKEEAIQKCYAKCQLIKGNYYYFATGNNESGLLLQQGDLFYTLMDKTNIYDGFIPKLAAHFIRLQDVYEEPFYDRYLVFHSWTKEAEDNILDSIIKDIKFTANYFITNDPSIDKLIKKGNHAGKKTLTIMNECKLSDVTDFLNYIIARPRIYAGREWKMSEIFATWLSEGAPTVLQE